MSISHPYTIIEEVEREQQFNQLVESFQDERQQINQQLIDMFNFPFDPNMYRRLMERIQEIDRKIELHRPWN
jgi:uncharacterized protein (UPF0276 family)